MLPGGDLAMSRRLLTEARGTATWPGLRRVVALLVTFTASPALADRREVYTVLAFEPGMCRFEVPVGSGASTSKYCNALAVATYYGLTNSLHLGGRIRVTRTTDVRFAETTVRLGDGSASHGDVFEDHWALGIGGLAVYRFDTRARLAPLAELEAGVMTHKYDRIEHIPSGVAYSVPQGSQSATELYAAASLLLEYRLATRWVASAGISGQVESGGLRPWSITVPLRAGFIW